jgi:23S rRNA pseudouridine2605 synthase
LPEIRLQKILSGLGYGSRRECEKWIKVGRVKVNGKHAELGQKADPDRDRIELDNVPLTIKSLEDIYIAFHKPRKVLSETKKLDDRKVVTDFIPHEGHLFIVGRLDYDSEGLLLLTNNGELANLLTHPRYEHDKEYHVMTSRTPDSEQLSIWRRGVVIEDGYRTLPAQVDMLPSGSRNWMKVVMKEGKKRQIREIGKAIGLPISRIIRKRIATVQLGTLRPGEWRYLRAGEVADLLQHVKK